jgi:phosphoribosylformylglycinamidine synthase
MTAYTATVTVRLKRGVLDPEAETTASRTVTG